ncbi:MAG TPA: low-specificity L-threonine aldolase [Chthonomonadales bacterium]|nr:low-specificity L-threonine aldolase [Chthonomonadales bacterium]
MHEVIDLRSDTVTKPTLRMRHAIAEAAVGDDVFEDDPTVNLLQQRAAELMGKEAGLFVPSGTMGNAVAIKTHTKPGDEILLDSCAHSMLYEVGLPAVIASVITRQFPSANGIPSVCGIAEAIHEESVHSPGTSLIVLENTHNRAGGAVIPVEVHSEIRVLAQERRVSVHLDGARIFNAAVAAGLPASAFAACADSVTFCLSKGLGCPVGSVLCGDAGFIHRARRVRKMLGGGMRQAGVLAAAGLYALDHHIERLAEDHRNARALAEGISRVPGITLIPEAPPTNMVYFTAIAPASAWVSALKQNHNILAISLGPNLIRLVTHLDIDQEDIRRAIAGIERTARYLAASSTT